MKFHHIGVACKDINQTIDFVQSVFEISTTSSIVFDSNQNVDLCLLIDKFGMNIELVCGKKVEKFIKNKQYFYHTCWEVDDLVKSINHFCKKGAIIISEPKPAILFNNKKVAFLFTEIGIVELLEKKASL
tara:strand:- start:2 stop:391 length:390 start_codon:yes stop_codon:yes gene_type:complete